MNRRRTKKVSKATGTTCLFIKSEWGNFIACDAIQSVKAKTVDQNTSFHYAITVTGISMVETLATLDHRNVPTTADWDLDDLAERVSEFVAIASRAKDYPVAVAGMDGIIFAAMQTLQDEDEQARADEVAASATCGGAPHG